MQVIFLNAINASKLQFYPRNSPWNMHSNELGTFQKRLLIIVPALFKLFQFFVMLIDAPCLNSNAVASVEFRIAARWTGVLPKWFGLCTSAPLCRSNRMTSVLLNCPDLMSAIGSSTSAQSTGILACNISSTVLTSPSTAHSRNEWQDLDWFLWKKQ